MRCAALALLLLVAAAPRARADLDGDRFESSDWRIRLDVPALWRATEKTAYPNVLLRMVRHSPDGQMLLTAEEVEPNMSSADYAGAVAERLELIGFEVRAPQVHPGTGAYLIDFENQSAHLRQAVLVAGGTGYSLTLAARDPRTRGQLLRAFDSTLRSLKIVREPAREPEPKEKKRGEAGAP